MSTDILPEIDTVHEDDDEPESYRPALRHLAREQLETLEEFRDQGVRTRCELLEWLLNLQYRTLGRVPDFWYYHVATEPTSLAVVLTGENRGRFGSRPTTSLTREDAWKLRRRLVADALRPACRDAFRELRTSATEYLDDDRPDVSGDRIAPLALRPSFEAHLTKQQEAMRDFLDGFESLEALDGWLASLDDVLHGSMKEVHRSFDHEIVSDKLAQEVAVQGGETYRRRREELIARWYLPACNVSVRAIANSAGETQTTTSEHQGGVDV